MNRSMRLLPLVALLVPGAAVAQIDGPLVGTWNLESYVDTPEEGPPVYDFGEKPVGLFVVTREGYISISLMHNPPAPAGAPASLDPDACNPAWYCAYFGTVRVDYAKGTWTAHVTGGNIPNYLGTDQTRHFRIEGDRLIVSETYKGADGRMVHGVRTAIRVRAE